MGGHHKNPDPHNLEDSSVHYYIPQTGKTKEYLYYPVSVGYFQCKPSYHLDRNNHDNFLIIVMLSGSLSYTALHSRGVVYPGYALLLDCHLLHSYKANGKCSFVYLHFNGAHSKEIYAVIESTLGNVLRLSHIDPVHENIGEIMNCMATGRRISSTHASTLIYEILMHLMAADPVESEGSTGNPFMDQALDYIHNHLSSRISVQEIAESIGYSESYFSHKFLEATGSTPYQFVLKCRIERAQLLLQTTSLSIQEIATQTGFNSVANFSHSFKKSVGSTPHQFRERPI